MSVQWVVDQVIQDVLNAVERQSEILRFAEEAMPNYSSISALNIITQMNSQISAESHPFLPIPSIQKTNHAGNDSFMYVHGVVRRINQKQEESMTERPLFARRRTISNPIIGRARRKTTYDIIQKVNEEYLPPPIVEDQEEDQMRIFIQDQQINRKDLNKKKVKPRRKRDPFESCVYDYSGQRIKVDRKSKSSIATITELQNRLDHQTKASKKKKNRQVPLPEIIQAKRIVQQIQETKKILSKRKQKRKQEEEKKKQENYRKTKIYFSGIIDLSERMDVQYKVSFKSDGRQMGRKVKTERCVEEIKKSLKQGTKLTLQEYKKMQKFAHQTQQTPEIKKTPLILTPKFQKYGRTPSTCSQPSKIIVANRDLQKNLIQGKQIELIQPQKIEITKQKQQKWTKIDKYNMKILKGKIQVAKQIKQLRKNYLKYPKRKFTEGIKQREKLSIIQKRKRKGQCFENMLRSRRSVSLVQ